MSADRWQEEQLINTLPSGDVLNYYTEGDFVQICKAKVDK
jgi:hypothetical protein